MKNVDFYSVRWINGFRCILLLCMFFLTGKLQAEIIVNTFQVTDPENIDAIEPYLGVSSQNYVAYTVHSPTPPHMQIYFHLCSDIHCNNPEIISDGSNEVRLLGTHRNLLLYTSTFPNTSLQQLVIFNKDTGAELRATNLEQGIFTADIHPPYFVYDQFNVFPPPFRFVLLNEISLEPTSPRLISLPDDNAESPRIGSRYAVFERLFVDKQLTDVMAYDLLTESTFCVACESDAEVSSGQPDTSGAWVIYETGIPGDQLYLVAENLETGERQTVKQVPDTSPFTQFQARIDGDFITFSVIPEGQEKTQIFLYQLSTQQTYQITDDSQCDYVSPVIFEDLVAYNQWCNRTTPSETFAVYISHFDIIPDAPDEDNDGIPDDVDLCPFEDATGLDANADGCIDSLGDLTELVERLLNEEVIDVNMATSLLLKVTIANSTNDNDQENICAAVNVLEAFKSQIDAQRGKKISDDGADLLIEFTDNAISDLLSSGVSC